ncbi:MAG: PAS domain S-box protein, partial [Ktedonobacteraceae bacterium]
FTLFCAYPIRYFAKEEDGAQLWEICQQHAHVIPDESYTMLADQDERLRAITLWQQKAHVLEAEVTERKNIEQRLRISENRYRRLFEASSDGVLIIDPRTGTITDANPSLSTLVGYSLKQMRGQHLWQIGLFADQQAAQNALRDMRIQRMLRYETMPLHLKNGERRYVDFVSTLFQSNGHSVIQCTLRDITARKRIEEALQQSESTLRSSQEQLQIALAASSTGTFRWDPFMGVFLEFDANLKQLFGFSPDAQVRVTEDFLVRVHPQDVPAIITVIARCRQGADFGMEYRVVHPDGSVHWLYNRAKMERDEQGKPLYLVGACTDITQRKQMEDALRESAEHLSLMAESMPQKIFTAQPNGDVDYFNPQWMEFTGLSLEEIKGWGWLQFIHPYDVEENINRWRHSIETGEPFFYEHRFRRADGVYRWHLTRTIPVRDAQGHITMWIGSNTDITEQKELAYQKEALVSMTTHELRTPLTSMKGYMQLAERLLQKMLQSPQITEEQRKTMLDQILLMLIRSQQQLNIQNRLITDLLDTSRAQEGTLELHLTSCDLGRLVSNAVENYRAVYPQRQIILDLPEQAVLMIQADSDRIVQVLSNYLTNALKYSADDKVVQVGMTCEPSMARIWVADQGPGLAREAQQHIWERFYRAPGIVAQHYTGASLGLGLSICQGII